MATPEIQFQPNTSAGPLDPAVVRKAEKMMGRSFPADFLEFLGRHNGGVPRQRYFDLDGNVKVIERFLCLVERAPGNEEHRQYHIGAVWSQISDRLNEDLVPFAALFPGDFLCFDFSAGETPAVVWWNHDLSLEDEPHTEPVAPSFADLLGTLRAEG